VKVFIFTERQKESEKYRTQGQHFLARILIN